MSSIMIVEGLVLGLRVTPQCRNLVLIMEPEGAESSPHILWYDTAATIDGVFAEDRMTLLSWVMKNECWAKLTLDPEQYDRTVRAEFSSIKR